MSFDLPDFDTPLGIEPSTIDAMGVVYAAYQFDQLRMFDVVDRIVERSMTGQLPIGPQASTALFDRWRTQADRLSQVERRQFYCRTLGLACGSTDEPAPNREFNGLWTRFVAAVSAFVGQLWGSTEPTSQAGVISAGRDLAANLSLHGYGIGLYVARDLQQQLSETVRILSDPEIRSAFGARDMWHVVDQVATLDLGGARQTVRYRTLASTGTVIIRWLARHSAVLTADAATVLDTSLLLSYTPGSVPPRLSPTPTDLDLVMACEHWLAVAGTTSSEDEDDR